MKTYKEMASELFMRREEYLKKRAARRGMILKLSVITSCLCLLTVGVWVGYTLKWSNTPALVDINETELTETTDEDYMSHSTSDYNTETNGLEAAYRPALALALEDCNAVIVKWGAVDYNITDSEIQSNIYTDIGSVTINYVAVNVEFIKIFDNTLFTMFENQDTQARESITGNGWIYVPEILLDDIHEGECSLLFLKLWYQRYNNDMNVSYFYRIRISYSENGKYCLPDMFAVKDNIISVPEDAYKLKVFNGIEYSDYDMYIMNLLQDANRLLTSGGYEGLIFQDGMTINNLDLYFKNVADITTQYR